LIASIFALWLWRLFPAAHSADIRELLVEYSALRNRPREKRLFDESEIVTYGKCPHFVVAGVSCLLHRVAKAIGVVRTDVEFVESANTNAIL
jgi:hypothetical protein